MINIFIERITETAIILSMKMFSSASDREICFIPAVILNPLPAE